MGRLLTFPFLFYDYFNMVNWQIRPPMIKRLMAQKPQCSRMYFQLLLSNKALMATMGKTKNTDEIKPCRAPWPNVLKLSPYLSMKFFTSIITWELASPNPGSPITIDGIWNW